MPQVTRPQPINSWGLDAFKQFSQDGLKASTAFKASLQEFWQPYIARQSPFEDWSVFCSLGPTLDDNAEQKITDVLLAQANPNNPVDVFMLCNAAIRLECGPTFYEKPENLSIESISGTCSDRAALAFRQLAAAPQAEGTRLGATLDMVLAPNFRMQHMDFIPSVSRHFDAAFWRCR